MTINMCRRRILLIFVFVIIAISASKVAGKSRSAFNPVLAEQCTTAKCNGPHCRCSGVTLPSREFRGEENEIPQFITVTFDDAVNVINIEQYKQIFNDLKNPDDCPAMGTFYISHEYTDYVLVNELYNAGHEIALHSVTHGGGTDFWRNATVDDLMKEYGNEIDMMERFGKVNRKHIRGMRAPFLQKAGNASYIAAKRLGLLYDASWPTLQYTNPPLWPYTLDYQSTQDCQIGPCPDVAIPGFWIQPMVSWSDTQNYKCSMMDACVYPPEDNVDALFDWMLSNFNRHYESNRAPFGMYLHAAWFSRGVHHMETFIKFLRHVNTLPNVYITTPSRVIQYLRNPTLGPPFKGCLKIPHTACKPVSCAVRKQSDGETRYMRVCDSCPEVYPWIDNPLGYM